MSQPAEPRLCPSARCEPGAILLGLIDQHGKVNYLTPQMVIDQSFVEKAHQGRAPESRFRFVQPCAECGCHQWTGTRCSVIDRAMEVAEEVGIAREAGQAVPHCSIRSRCRWFAQSGPEACGVCPLIITEVEESK